MTEYERGVQDERERCLSCFPLDFCNDGEYTDKELAEHLSDIIKGVYRKIETQ